jgi:hypothetical protein
MKIQKRRVNSQGHTLGLMVGGKWRTRSEAVKLAQRNKIDGVTVCQSHNGYHLRSLPESRNIYDLPEVLV